MVWWYQRSSYCTSSRASTNITTTLPYTVFTGSSGCTGSGTKEIHNNVSWLTNRRFLFYDDLRRGFRGRVMWREDALGSLSSLAYPFPQILWKPLESAAPWIGVKNRLHSSCSNWGDPTTAAAARRAGIGKEAAAVKQLFHIELRRSLNNIRFNQQL